MPGRNSSACSHSGKRLDSRKSAAVEEASAYAASRTGDMFLPRIPADVHALLEASRRRSRTSRGAASAVAKASAASSALGSPGEVPHSAPAPGHNSGRGHAHGKVGPAGVGLAPGSKPRMGGGAGAAAGSSNA